MPWRQKTFKPAWLKRPAEARPSSHERGYGSAAWQRVRKAVIARDGGICQMCFELVAGSDRDLHIDHIVEKQTSEAADATPLDGLQLLCRRCHSIKTKRGY